MKVRAVDIARALGLSKATVSLALNGKPGVSEKTRQQVLDYREKAEAGLIEQRPAEDVKQETSAPAGTQIKVLMVSGGMKNIKNQELDLWTDVRMILERDFREHGFSMVLTYTDINDPADFQSALRSCNDPSVAGVLVEATELRDGQVDLFDTVHKPMVLWDYMTNDIKYSFVSINNRQGVRLAVDELMSTGNRDILYLGMTMPMYNYLSRQRGFIDAMTVYGYSAEEAKKRIVLCADTIMGARDFMMDYLEKHPLPQAFLCDSYHESIGLIDALKRKDIRIPQDVSVIGIDTLPEYTTGGMQFTSVRVPHTVRARWAAEVLYKEMKEPVKEKIQLYVNCRLIRGETVADRIGTRQM